MARKGILPRRKRGRTTLTPSSLNLNGGNTIISSTTSSLDAGIGNQNENNPSPSDLSTTSSSAHVVHCSRSSSPSEPPYHFANFKLPELRPKLV